MRLLSPPPEVVLVNAHRRPLDNAVAAARTCYAGKGIVLAEDVADDDARDALARDVYAAGHHTVFQHAHFQFAITRLSRHATWAFFHAHPYYNSEQVSQRYVAVGREAALVPDIGGGAPQARFEATLALLDEAYRRLTASLTPIAESVFFSVYPARRRDPAKWAREIRRKAQEAARYVLPVATWARMHHTVSALTLMRYRRTCATCEVPSEVTLAVDAMVAAVTALDPALGALFEAPLDAARGAESRALADAGGMHDARRAAAFCTEFDASLEGRVSRLVAYAPDAERAVAQAVREVLGLPASAMSDDDALALAASPAANPLFGEALNLTEHAPLTRALHHASYTFRRRISHTADSQDQRHRTTPASRPILAAQLGDTPDVVLPALAAVDDAVRCDFNDTLARTWEALGALRAAGIDEEALVYLLPNAVAVRTTESGDFAALRHKHAMRLCFNAQEEIWRASLDEAQQITAVHPRLGAYLQPPCSVRLAGRKTPYCPEGKRYCGVPVWKKPPGSYARII